MSLTDILGNAGAVAGYALGAGVFVYGLKKLMKEHYIPWTNEVEKELDEEPLDDYNISSN